MRLLRQIPSPHWGTLLSGVLIVAAYPPWDLRFLAWICLIPWFFAITQARSWRLAALQGLWLGVLMSLLGFHWVAYVLHQFGELPWIVAVIGLALYSLIGQPQFLLFAPLFFLFHSSTAPASERNLKNAASSQSALGITAGPALVVLCIGLALFYTGLDWVIPKLFKDTLGHAFYSAPWIRQAAEIGGAHLLTFGAMWLNLAIFFALLALKKRQYFSEKLAAVANIGFSLALIGAFAVFGMKRAEEWRERLSHPESTLQAGIIQANIGDFDKVAAERGMQQAAEKILADYFNLSDQALALQKKPNVIIWPETAYASTYGKAMTTADYSRDQRIESWVKSNHAPLLFGSYDRDEGKDFNTFYILSPLSAPQLTSLGSVSENLQFYHKNILLMFGEYIPLQDVFPVIGRLFPQVANFGRGPGPEILQIPVFSDSPSERQSPQLTSATSAINAPRLIPASPAICYEVLFPNYVLEAARKGSRLILNITNDSWFGPYGEPHLHLALSTFRSIETRLPMIRATNTGFSALVTQDGEIASKSRLFEPEILNVSVPLIDPPATLIKSWGDWFGPFALLAGALTLILLTRRFRPRSIDPTR